MFLDPEVFMNLMIERFVHCIATHIKINNSYVTPEPFHFKELIIFLMYHDFLICYILIHP